jgi:hypothetical protein
MSSSKSKFTLVGSARLAKISWPFLKAGERPAARRTASAIEPPIENTWLWRRWSGTYVKSTLAVADLFP